MRKILLIVAAAVTLASCSTNTWKNINYLQDVSRDTTMTIAVNKGIIIQPRDQISILVSSRNASMSAQFNKSIYQSSAGSGELSVGTQRTVGYAVDNEGDIDFPCLGKLHVAGLNRWELQDLVTEKLVNGGLLTDANVTVEFMNLKISVLGEVSAPGTYAISGDKMTIFDAISLANDLTIMGERSNVMVIREQNGERLFYHLDLRDSGIFGSPAFYLQQNDVVYVTPNNVRAGQSTINENYFKSAGFWMTMATMGITITNFILTLAK